MKRSMLLLIAACLLASPASAQGIADLVERVRSSVAYVYVQGPDLCSRGCSGSAFVEGADGLFVTALHVVQDATTVSVLLPGGTPTRADVIAIDVPDDLAVLQTDQRGLTPLILSTTGTVRAGQDVIVLGYPLANQPLLEPSAVTVTKGIVSALRPPYIQLDAAMNHGNSGGPVFDSAGEVIGVADWRYAGEGVAGLNFAVSSDAVAPLLRGAVDPQLPHNALSLPLRVTRSVQVTYDSGTFRSTRVVERHAVACLTPPADVMSVIGLRGELHTKGPRIEVLTWLTINDQGPFAEMSNEQPSYSVQLREERQPPKSMCINFSAVSGLLLDRSFQVTYWLDYKAWPSP